MMNAAAAAAALITAHQPPAARRAPAAGGSLIGLALADAGYLSARNLTCPGPDRLIATGKRRALEHTAADSTSQPASHDGERTAIAAMTARLATGDGITAYRQRGHIAETPHAAIKHNLAIRQLSLRGKRHAAAEWTFITAVANLLTAITSGHLTRQALAELAT
jgi:hypothetical protein